MTTFILFLLFILLLHISCLSAFICFFSWVTYSQRTVPTMPCIDCRQLQKANRSITHLKEDICRLSAELKQKDVFLSSFIDTASAQAKKITALNSAVSDTIQWDTLARPRPSSCSTPNSQATWTEVVVRNHKKSGLQVISPPALNLSNRFGVLPMEAPVPPADISMVAGATRHVGTGCSSVISQC